MASEPVSTYLRYRERAGRFVPFAPPLPSPKHTGTLNLRQQAHWWMWRCILPLWSERVYKCHRPIFLIGCHNSGTTILARLIGQHPGVVNWSEAPEVWTPDDAFLNWSVMQNPPLPVPFLFGIAAYERTVEKHGHFIPTIRSTFGFFTFTRHGKRLMNKNPHMCISIPYIEAVFPDAQYVYIRRNGYAVVQSLVSNWGSVLQQVKQGEVTPWSKLRDAIDPVYFDDPLAIVRLCARYWRDMDAWAYRDLQALENQNRVFYTTYDAICVDPEAILRELFGQFDLNPARYDWNQLQNPTGYPWADMLPMENRDYKYRERLTSEQIDAITHEVHDTLAEYGYLDSQQTAPS